MTVAATTSAEQAVRQTWDAVVVGAGPAGAMAAHELARRGLHVLLVDRASFPRWKVCGCCLNAHALAALNAAGLGALTVRCGAVPLSSLRLATGGRVASVPLSGSVSLSRESFDAALVTAAIEAGTEFLPGTQASLPRSAMAGPGQIADGGLRMVELQQQEKVFPLTTRVVLVADGLGGKLLARAGVRGVCAETEARIGAGVVAASGPAFYTPGVIFMACGRFGYLGLVRLEDGRLDLAAAFNPVVVRERGGLGRTAVELLAEVGWPVVPGLAELDWRGTPTLTRRVRRLASEGLFVLGDAAGYVEPFTGEGISWALAAGRAVAPLVVRAARCWHPQLVHQWTTEYLRQIGQRHVVCGVIAAVLRSPWLTRSAIGLLAHAPALAAPVTRYLGCAAHSTSRIQRLKTMPDPRSGRLNDCRTTVRPLRMTD
jgi:flavin-dependent dehydrogenase